MPNASSAMWRAPVQLENAVLRSEEHTSELQSQSNLVCRLLLEKKKKHTAHPAPSLTFPAPITRDPSPPVLSLAPTLCVALICGCRTLTLYGVCSDGVQHGARH